MKKQVVGICLLLVGLSANSQGFFSQKKTKLKYIAQQIAAFQVYAGYVQKGYTIANEGLGLINDIKHGDFDIHNNYFNSLKAVNPSIAGYNKTEDTKTAEENIRTVSEGIVQFINNNNNIQEDEIEYINRVVSGLLNSSEDAMRDLVTITSDGTLEMTDDERISCIDVIHSDMLDKYAFIKYFDRSVKLVSLSREREMNDKNTAESLYNLK